MAGEKKIEIKVEMGCTCSGCERKVKKAVKGMKGVKHVKMEGDTGKLTVTGTANPNEVLERVMCRTRKNAEFWPKPVEVVPENHPPSPSPPSPPPSFQHHSPEPYYSNTVEPYYSNTVPSYYSNTVPPHNPEASTSSSSRPRSLDGEYYTTMFSDENTNSCFIM